MIEKQRKRGDARSLSDFALGSVWVWNQVSDTKRILRDPGVTDPNFQTLFIAIKSQ